MTDTHAHEEVQVADRVTFGFWVYLMSDCVLFAGFFAAYAVLHTQLFGGEAPGELFSLPFVLTETFILLTSSFTCGLAMLAMHHKKREWMLTALVITLLLGWAFIGMEITEFRNLILEGNGPDRSAFLSSFFSLVGTHGLHVTFGSLWMLVLMLHVYFRGLTETTTRKLVLMSLFWHFLDLIWIFIFSFIYLFGFI